MKTPIADQVGQKYRLRTGGFTLVELLVVIAVIALLVSLALPAIARAKSHAQAIQCLGNSRSLILAWTLYSDDHAGKICANSSRLEESWIRGYLDFEGHNPSNTNASNLIDPRYAKLGPYLSTPAVYKCPQDRSFVTFGGRNYPRVRSVSMNYALGAEESPGQLPFSPGYMVFRKFAEMSSPANLWVLIDEHPDSLDDPQFVVDCEHVGESAQWVSVPANFHNNAANLAFADGHSEGHQWHDPSTLIPNKYCGCVAHLVDNGFYTAGPHSRDIAWLQERTSTRLAGMSSRTSDTQ